MNLDPYERWLEAKRGPEVPPSFARRVMARVGAEGKSALRRQGNPWLLAGAWAAASVVLLVRLGAVLAVFWSS